jgi:hypothetical protein
MKITIAAVLAACAPSVAFGLVGNNWSFRKTPAQGLNDITFPFNIAKAPHQSGYYYAQQFNFLNVENVGYTGLQPRPNAKGHQIVHAAFSSFQSGTTSKHPNCSNGADGGAGVSCAVEINGDYSHTYNLVVENTKGTTWRGSLGDTKTKKSTVVGEWTLPSGSGKIVGNQVGFVEYYPWNSQASHTCGSLPWTESVFYNPTTKTKGASGGAVTSVYEYGDCIGKAGYKLRKVSGGYDITVGFKNPTN